MAKKRSIELSFTVPQIILVGLLVISSFFIGTLYTKVQLLEGGGGGTANDSAGAPVAAKSKYKSFDDAIVAIAKSVKLDGNKLLSCMNSGEKQDVVAQQAKQGEALGVSGTPTFFVNGRTLGGAYPFSEFKTIIDEELAGTADSTLERAVVEVGDAPFLGPTDAPITLIEFSDFECPFCARAFPTIQQILTEYDGQVQFVYKHFPLTTIHPKAQKVAEASECARDQGKFFEFHDALFEQQQDWISA